MNEKEIKERVNSALKNKLPIPCGNGCPVVCCNPIITGNLMPKNLLEAKDNFEKAIEFLNFKKDEILQMKAFDGTDCFNFEGAVITNIDTEQGFITDSQIEIILKQKLDKPISKQKLKELTLKVKERFKEINVALVTVYSCKHYNYDSMRCTIHNIRPNLCRDYFCEQLEPEKIANSFEEMVKRIALKKEQRDYVNKRILKEPIKIINLFSNL